MTTGFIYIKPNISNDLVFDHFQRLHTPDYDVNDVGENIDIDNVINDDVQIMFDELDNVISVTKVVKAIHDCTSGKCAADDLLNEFLKKGVHVLANPVTKLFNHLYVLGYFPDSWAEGIIIPLHKKGDVNNISNYRGITLLSVLGKLFTRVINNRLHY